MGRRTSSGTATTARRAGVPWCSPRRRRGRATPCRSWCSGRAPAFRPGSTSMPCAWMASLACLRRHGRHQAPHRLFRRRRGCRRYRRCRLCCRRRRRRPRPRRRYRPCSRAVGSALDQMWSAMTTTRHGCANFGGIRAASMASHAPPWVATQRLRVARAVLLPPPPAPPTMAPAPTGGHSTGPARPLLTPTVTPLA